MKKGIALIALLLAAALMLSGCNLIGYDEALDGAQVVAKVNDTELTKEEWLAYREYLAKYYQDYYYQYFGVSMPMDEETIASYGEGALEMMIQSTVLEDKLEELGYDVLSEEETADVESYADQMVELYKSMLRYQNYPDLETVEEEQARLAAEAAASEATPSEATPAEATASEAAVTEATPAEPAVPVATVTDAELDAMLEADLAAMGYDRDYFVDSQSTSIKSDKLREYAIKDVDVTDEQVKAEFDTLVADQKAKYDETPTSYASDVQAGVDVYYVPAGYRGVKNLLIKFSTEKQDEITALNDELTTAQNALDAANSELETLKAEDTSAYDEETLAAYNEQVTALEEQAAQAQATIDETQPKIDETTEAAYAEILPYIQDVLEQAQGGTDFDTLIMMYGEDDGMYEEPAKTQGYLVCEGLNLFVPEFQEAAMALENVGDISAEPVKTTYGYHILQYATDIASGEVEYTDEIKTSLHDTLLTETQDAAYDAAVNQWVSEADVKTFPKVME